MGENEMKITSEEAEGLLEPIRNNPNLKDWQIALDLGDNNSASSAKMLALLINYAQSFIAGDTFLNHLDEIQQQQTNCCFIVMGVLIPPRQAAPTTLATFILNHYRKQGNAIDWSAIGPLASKLNDSERLTYSIELKLLSKIEGMNYNEQIAMKRWIGPAIALSIATQGRFQIVFVLPPNPFQLSDQTASESELICLLMALKNKFEFPVHIVSGERLGIY